MSRTPPAEVDLDSAVVAALIADQCPDLAHLPVSPMGNGWDNYMFSVGDQYVARLPRREVAVELLEHERIYLPQLADGLPIPTPAFIYAGKPGHGYPWPWLLIPKFAGNNPDREELLPEAAPQLAGFLCALHRPDDGPKENRAPANTHRGVPLINRDETLKQGWQIMVDKGEPLTPELVALWEKAKHLPPPEIPVWLHGDLHYANVLVHKGMFSAIVDWGDICSGDPATDLAAFWLFFDDADARQAGLNAYGLDAELRLRAMGWALSFSTILLSTGIGDNPRHAQAGREGLKRLLQDF